jgi:hypothetical protein
MAEAVIFYDKDLPEIPEHCAFLEPDRFLRKKAGGKDEFEIVEGRRPSRLILLSGSIDRHAASSQLLVR